MTAILMSILTQDEVTNTSRSDGKVTGTTIVSERRFQMDLMLTPDGDPECQKLGFVHLHIDCKPEMLPDMTREQTRAWMCERLKAML